MRTSSPLLKHWLRLQCQMVFDCTQGLLVRFEQSDPVAAGIWPDGSHADDILIDCARDVLAKQRLTLQKDQQDYFIGFPISLNKQFWGAIVLKLSSHDSEKMKAVIKLLGWGTTWLQFIIYDYDTFLSAAQSSTDTPPNNQQIAELKRQQHFLELALREPSLQETAIAAVNFLCTQLGFGRVSLGLWHNKKLHLTAVSHAAHFDPRSQPMQTIQEAMLEAIQQQQAILQTADNGAQKPATGVITLAHKKLLETHRLATCYTTVLTANQKVVGALTIETPETLPHIEKACQFIDNSSSTLGHIIALKTDNDKSIGAALKRTGSRWLTGLFGSNSPVETAVLASLLIFFICLFIPMEFKVTSNAQIESTNKYLVVSPYQGFIGDIQARPGDLVEQDQLLARLKDEDLTLERRKLSSQLQQYRLEYDNALASGNRAEAAILNAQVEQSNIQLRLLEQKLARIQLRSPINGIVVSEDISQQLGAPVEQGEVLFEIADNNRYQVALYVKEKDIAYLKTQQQGQLSLTSLPGQFFNIAIARITPLSEIRNNVNVFRVDADIASAAIALRPGMTGSAKIDIEKRPFGWILLRDFWHWLRFKLWV